MARIEQADTARARWDGWSLEDRRDFIRGRLAAVVVKPVGRIGRRPDGLVLSADEVELVPRRGFTDIRAT